MGLFDDLMPIGSGGGGNVQNPRLPPLDSQARDYVIRTVLGEAGSEPDEGQAGVAAVIKNRRDSGRYGPNAVNVVLTPGQFEPWMTPQGRQRMMQYPPDSPAYQKAGEIVDRVFTEGYDPTGGATHFYSPTAQSALGRQPPKWAQGDGLPIGRHTFFAPEGRVGATDVSAQSRQPAQSIGLFNDLVPQGAGGRSPEVNPVTVSPEADTGGRFTDNAGENFRVAREGVSAPPKGLVDKLVAIWEDPPKDKLSLIGMIKSAYEGATLPGDVQSGKVSVTGEDGRTNPEVIQRSAQLAQAVPMGPAPGGMLARPNVADQALLANTPAKAASVPSVAELKSAASAGYQSSEVKGLVIKPEAVQSLSQSIVTKLSDAGLDENLAPKTFGILSKLDKAPEGAVVTGDNLQSLRRTLGNAAGSIDPTERLAAKSAMETLDGFLSSIPTESVVAGDATKAAQTLGTARANYASAMQAENIDKKAIQAELRAAAANSGQNVANTVRQRMADIILKPAERRGYTPDELAQMEKIVRGGIIDNALRGAGNLLGGGGGMGAVISAGVGGFATGGPGAVAPVIGYALKRLGNAMTLRQAEKLSEMVRSRAPLAKSMEDFGDKAAQLEAIPGPKSMAAVALASRNLANNMRDAGINMSVSDIMRGIQGPARGAADQDQQD
jgi:hypothetical protein